MYHSFCDVFAAGAERALIVPSDTPNLSCAVIAEACQALDVRDAALGPASDGGYYLLGLKAPHRALFFDVPWSTATVAERTRERLRQLGLSWGEITELPDIDEERDLHEWLRGPFARRHPLKPRIEELLARVRP
jgi:glycosyltransferase A (GT-A) superfamily protein (DUF2064 family)